MCFLFLGVGVTRQRKGPHIESAASNLKGRVLQESEDTLFHMPAHLKKQVTDNKKQKQKKMVVRRVKYVTYFTFFLEV